MGKYMNHDDIQFTNHEAILSSTEGFTVFSFGGYIIRFKAPYSLECYVDVESWDDGYLVVLAKYRHNAEPEDEYIDLKPILEGLYIADKADVIINGYAFTREDDRIRVLNLHNPDKAVVFGMNCEVLETTMDDIELSIVSRYLQQNLKYMEN